MDLTDFNFILFISNYVIPDQSSVFYTSCKLECAFMTDYKGHDSFFYHPDTMACLTVPEKIYTTQNLVYDNGFQYWTRNTDICEPNPCTNAGETCFPVEDSFECRCINIVGDNIITSPNYPANYPLTAKCYIIIGQHEHHINLILDSQYSIEAYGKCNEAIQTDNCPNDYLELQGLRYCGGVPPNPIRIPTGQNTTVRFVTDEGTGCTGFNLSIKYTYVKVITSPNYPSNYPKGFDKTYFIIGRPGQNINLNLDAMYAIEARGSSCNDTLTMGADGCGYDYLELHRERYCGGEPPNPIIIPTGQDTTVRFITDGTTQCTGFNLRITYTTIDVESQENKGEIAV